MTVDSASWRSGNVARFGALTPAVALSPLDSALHVITADDASDTALEPPSAPIAAWAVSACPEGGLARSFHGRPVFFRVNGTDSHLRPLTAVLTRAPAGGTLSLTSPIGAVATADAGEEKVLEVGDTVPVGTRLVYQPNPGAHDSWDSTGGGYGGIGNWTTEASPYDWLSYRVETEGGEISANEVDVVLSVRVNTDSPHLSWPSKVRN